MKKKWETLLVLPCLSLLHDQKISILIFKDDHRGFKLFQEVAPSCFSDFSHALDSF